MATIGAIISQLRADKNIRVSDLVAGVGISEATYNRILTGESVLKLPVLFGLCIHLRVNFRDIEPRLDPTYMPFMTAWHRVYTMVPQVMQRNLPREAISQEFDQLEAAYTKTGNIGFRQLATVLQLVQSQISHDFAQSRQIAAQLFAEIDQYDEWTHFELTLLSHLLPFMPFKDVKKALQRLGQFNTPTIVSTYSAYADLFDTMLIGALFNALRTREPANVRFVTAAYAARIVPDTSLFFRALKREAHAIDLYLAGDQTAAQAEYTTIHDAVQFLVDDAANDALTIMQSLWTDTLALA